jgi:glycosyltransferase involved in cell wall biosynthesis
MQVSTPLVSIITPLYNTEKYISEAILSVINQSYKHWELIIINDGSTDTSESIVRSFDDSRISVFSQENAGVSVARNKGIALARGEYITFLDADDVLTEDSLKARIVYLQENEEVDMLHGGVSIRDSALANETQCYFPFAYNDLFKKILALDSRLVFNPSYMMKKTCLNTIRFKEGLTHCEDILFLAQMMSLNVNYASISEKVYYYRVSDSSAMSNISGLIEGYESLLTEVQKIAKVTYRDTLIMRIKILRIMLSWYLRNFKVIQIFSSFKILFK